ncbi:MAG TPA: hypothetical protein PLH72_06250 [Vicinamibacterales bacterium]|nr:hypothetical protein [Vicinamibacterales bacterium]
MSDEYSPPISSRRWTTGAVVLVIAALAIALMLTAAPAWHHLHEPAPPTPAPVRATWALPDELAPGAGASVPFDAALALDGRRVAFSAARDGRVALWLQDLRTGETNLLPGTDAAALPFWAPDGSRIGFFAGASVRAFDVATAEVTELLPVEAAGGASWNRRGDLVVSASDAGGLIVRSVDGALRTLTTVDVQAGERAHRFPVFLPDGDHVVYFVAAESTARGGVWITALGAGARPARIAGSAAHAIAAGGGLLFSVDGALVAQRLDPVAARLTGPVTLLSARVGHGPLGQLLATASDDVLITAPPASSLRELVWMTRAGVRAGTVGAPSDTWRVRIGPDGRRVLATVLDPLLRTLDVVLFDGLRPVPARVSLSIDADDTPVWSPDGTRVAWVSAGRTIMVRGAGAVLPADTIRRFDEIVQVTDWTRDGRWLVVSRRMAATREDLWLVPVGDGASPRLLLATPFADVQGVVSPDGRWVAYASDEAGRFDVYVEPVPGRSPESGTRERVTNGGGSDPRWSRDGHALFFRRGSEIHVATPALGRGLGAATAASMVFKTGAEVRSFDVAPGEDRFLLNLPVSTPPDSVTVVVHWPRP